MKDWNKRRRRTRRFEVAVVAVLAIVALAANIAAPMFKGVLDSYLGRGEISVTTAEGSEAWDSAYYKPQTASLEETKKASDVVSEQMTDEGIVLLKDNGALPLAKGSTVSLFGYGYLDPAYSGSGAAATTDTAMVTVDQSLGESFNINSETVDAMRSAEPSSPGAAEGTPALDFDTNSLQAMMESEEAAKIYEFDASIYEQTADSVRGTTGLVFIKRTGSEGIDKRFYGYDDGTPHYLAFTQAEKDTIKFAKENCDAVVVVLNTANPVELSPVMSGEYEADAIVWMGTAGSRGFASLSKILCGEVNPSGRLTDTYATDFTADPTFANFGDARYDNTTVTDTTMLTFIPGANKGTIDRPFIEYEEGIYVGYRYYETAAVEDSDFVYGALDAQGGVTQEGAVAYPFGYGLSYTSFDQEITSYDDSGDTVNVVVTVTNTGAVAGKDVVQLYYTSPYTDYDRTNGVEKSVTDLGDFGKTKLLDPGESTEVSLSLSKDDLASYDYHHANADGTTGCYVLEAGEYAIELKANSHDVVDSRTLTIANTTFFESGDARQSERNAQSLLDDEGTPTGVTFDGSSFTAATNQFQTLDDYMDGSDVTKLSRSNWKGTQPSEPENGRKSASQVALDDFERFDNFDYQSDPLLGNVEGSLVYAEEAPVSNDQAGLSLIDLRGVDYNDTRWSALLDQIDWDGDKGSIQPLLYSAAYQTMDVSSVSKPATTDKDGAMGWSVDGASSWASANVQASTWNVELVRQMGQCIGEEALQAGLTGWYAPAVNIHRSPFSGRAYEYYSEDATLSGKLSAATIGGAGDKGVISYLKHFALNDQETYRSIFLATWANEQAIREVYLRPFEIAVEDAKSTMSYISDDEGTVSTKVVRSATGIMSSQNSVGGTIGFAHHGLLTGVLRGEWNFEGAVVSDLYPSSSIAIRDMSIRAGTDMYMNQGEPFAADYDSPTARSVMRTALHRVLYATANSNAMNKIAPGTIVSYAMSPWQIGLYAATALIVVTDILIVWHLVRGKEGSKKRRTIR